MREYGGDIHFICPEAQLLAKKWFYGAPFVKTLYLTDLAQKLLSLRIFSYLCA